MRSGLYEGWVRHRRTALDGGDVDHAFRGGAAYFYLDLEELPRVFRGRWLWSVGRRNLAWFDRRDYLGDASVPLDQAVRDRVEAETGARPAGSIGVLTQVRMLGFCFNPVSFYYCWDRQGARVETVVAEITNTPWSERHAYVLGPASDEGRGLRRRHRFGKAFHVSPFLPMELDYDWRFVGPGLRPVDPLVVHMDVRDRATGRLRLDATLSLARREITARALARLLLTRPLGSLATWLGIYWNAARLRWKGAPFFAHPAGQLQGQAP